MGRPKKDRVRTNVSIEHEVFNRLELILLDPKKGGFRYGALSEIINKLLQKFLDTMEQPGVDPVAYLRAFGVEISNEKE